MQTAGLTAHVVCLSAARPPGVWRQKSEAGSHRGWGGGGCWSEIKWSVNLQVGTGRKLALRMFTSSCKESFCLFFLNCFCITDFIKWVQHLSLALSRAHIENGNSHVFPAEDNHVAGQQLETTAALWSAHRKRHPDEQLMLRLLCHKFICKQPQSICVRSIKRKQQKQVNKAGLAWVTAPLRRHQVSCQRKWGLLVLCAATLKMKCFTQKFHSCRQNEV